MSAANDTEPKFPADEIEIGLHPDGYRIDRTAAPMNRYTRWHIAKNGAWRNPEPICFHSLPETGWQHAERFDWGSADKDMP